MIKVTVTKVEGTCAIALPPEALAFLHVKEGDVLQLTESPEGFKLVSPNLELAHAKQENSKNAK